MNNNMPTPRELLEKQWVKKDGSIDTGMVEFCLKGSNFVDMGGYYIDFGMKPTIDSTIYYADQNPGTFEMAEDPGTSWETFRAYNMKNSPQDQIERIEGGARQATIMNNYHTDRTSGMIKMWSTFHTNHLRPTERLATEKELAIILEQLKAEQAKYEKRLAAYYKRYSHKIRTSSYWADR